jgi:hypothetical protein
LAIVFILASCFLLLGGLVVVVVMVIAIGTDIVAVARICSLVSGRHQRRFLQKAFHASEIASGLQRFQVSLTSLSSPASTPRDCHATHRQSSWLFSQYLASRYGGQWCGGQPQWLCVDSLIGCLRCVCVCMCMHQMGRQGSHVQGTDVA